MTIEQHIYRAQLYQVLIQLKKVRRPWSAIVYLQRDQLRYYFRETWKKYKETFAVSK